MNKEIYEFIKIDRSSEGPFEVPGEIIEVYSSQPYSKKSFTALVRISQDRVQRDDDEESEGDRVDLDDIEGVGETTAARIRASGFVYVDDFKDTSPEELAEIQNVGISKAKNILDVVEQEY